MKRIVVTLALLASIHHSYSVMPEPSCPQKRFGKVVEFGQTRSKSFDSKSFDEEVSEENTIVVVDFYSDKCGPCTKLAPRIRELAKELPNVKFMKVDTTKNGALVTKYVIRSIPQLLFFKNGDLQKARVYGDQTKDTIKKAINKLS